MGRRRIPSGVKQASQALALEGVPKAEIGRRFGVSPPTVAKWAAELGGLDPAAIAQLKAALPGLLTVLATGHATRALETLETDAAASTRHTLGAKLATEAARLSVPSASSPGQTMAVYIRNLQMTGKGDAPPTLEAEDAAIVPYVRNLERPDPPETAAP